MAITIINKPSLFSPSNSNNIWVFQSDNTSLIYYIVTVTNQNGTAVILNTKVYPVPYFSNNKCYINLNKVLENYVDYQFKEFNINSIDLFENQTIGYKINITEILINEVIGTVYNSTVSYLINMNLDLVSLKYFDYNNYTLSSINSTLIHFLNVKKTKVFTNDKADEGLYFLNNDLSSVTVNIVGLYNSNNNFLSDSNSKLIKTDSGSYIQIKNSYSINFNQSNLAQSGLYRINTSASYLSSNNNLNLNLTGLESYSVYLSDSNGNILSDTFTYLYKESECKYDYMNVYFQNKFGNTETITLKNPALTTQSDSKLTGIFNNYNYTDSGINIYNNNTFNQSEIVLNNSYSTIITAYTENISDKDFGYISDLITSNMVHIKLNDVIIPVIVQTSSVNLAKKLRKQDTNIVELQFKTDSNFSGFTIDNNFYN